MNPNNIPRIVNANIWDRHMEDAFSLSEPMQNADGFEVMSNRLNPESASRDLYLDEYSNACGTGKRNLCLNKCDVLHGDVVKLKCDAKHPFNQSKRRKCKDEVVAKRASCKNKCPKADAQCIEEKNNPPILDEPDYTDPPDTGNGLGTGTGTGAGTGQGGGRGGATEKLSDDKAKNILIYSSIALVGVIGISVVIWGISSAIKPSR